MGSTVQIDFSSGEIAPEQQGKVNTEMYSKGVKLYRNAWTMRTKGAQSRSGTHYISTVTENTDKVRMIPFIATDDTSFALEFGHFYIKIIKNGKYLRKKVIGDDGNETEIVVKIDTPYSNDELDHIRFTQKNDVMIIVSESDTVKELVQFAKDQFKLVDFQQEGIGLKSHIISDYSIFLEYGSSDPQYFKWRHYEAKIASIIGVMFGFQFLIVSGEILIRGKGGVVNQLAMLLL